MGGGVVGGGGFGGGKRGDIKMWGCGRIAD